MAASEFEEQIFIFKAADDGPFDHVTSRTIISEFPGSFEPTKNGSYCFVERHSFNSSLKLGKKKMIVTT